MFEKSLYDLIRGLRNHKGNEVEYIQNSLKECRAEIKSQDMDKKATALLKLIYLEMFGYDMSWASFHVLEVMSSANYLQKRVGYLGAVQSFRSDTEVLMLATNLLKKDIVSPQIPTLSLPLVTLPHIITPSLALSLLTDLLPRLSHSHPAVRKKAVVNLYRLSLVYPEAFRIAWPKIKERLMDDQEDSSVTAAIINVVCELGWRRPQDFLPLAPRLFDLLVDGGNNWMAIKIIKLFATLTPLEPRLVRKLLRPLTNIIQTTSAMSLLYECINGVIQGGLLDGPEAGREAEQIANLCVEKLRGMLVMEGDPNLKYVALLAFNRIVVSHPILVSMQQDVIMDCLDDLDISIRLQALELVAGMVNSDTLQPVVNRLITQLQTSPVVPNDDFIKPDVVELTPSADIEGDDPEERLEPVSKKAETIPPLPGHYRAEVLHRILDVCSRDNYSAILDFEWYVDVILQLVKLVPPLASQPTKGVNSPQKEGYSTHPKGNIASRIGSELRNVAVRVKDVRPEATRAAESLILVDNRDTLFPVTSTAGTDILEPASWIVGEYAEHLITPERTLNSLVHSSNISLSANVISSYLQAIPKLLVSLTSHYYEWDRSGRNDVSLYLARIVEFYEKLASHPDLDVQERAIEFLELLRLTAEAVSSSNPNGGEVPLLISSAIPSLFSGLDLNPVAAGAQKKIPVPQGLDLDKPLNEDLASILRGSENGLLSSGDEDEFQQFYYVPEVTIPDKLPQKEPLAPNTQQSTSYQSLPDDITESEEAIARRRAERKERNKDDPFYIGHDDGSSGSSTPFHQVLRSANGEELDIDSIPIIDLAIDGNKQTRAGTSDGEQKRKVRSKPRKVEILADETIDIEEDPSETIGQEQQGPTKPSKVKRSLLEVDSSGLTNLALEEDGSKPNIHNVASKAAEEAEMAKAMQEVERLRLEMQRASERIHAAQGVPPEGTLVKRKKKKAGTSKSKRPEMSTSASIEGPEVPETEGATPEEAVVKKKKKKKSSKKETLSG